MRVRRTSDLINPETRLCALCYSHPKFGKTTFAASLNALTKKYMNKPTLFIAVEAAEGGGTTSIREFDVEFVQPTNYTELLSVLTALQTDTYYGGVVLDNATDMVASILKPHALTFPTRGTPPATRGAGVPHRDDYQTMGELCRQVFNRLINLTKNPRKEIAKHLLVTALEKEKFDESGSLSSIQPDLPGQMAEATSAMFELVGSIQIKNRVIPNPDNPKATMRVKDRVFVTEGDGVKILGDRYKVFPQDSPLDWAVMWEKYWLPAANRTNRVAQ